MSYALLRFKVPDASSIIILLIKGPYVQTYHNKATSTFATSGCFTSNFLFSTFLSTNILLFYNVWEASERKSPSWAGNTLRAHPHPSFLFSIDSRSITGADPRIKLTAAQHRKHLKQGRGSKLAGCHA